MDCKLGIGRRHPVWETAQRRPWEKCKLWLPVLRLVGCGAERSVAELDVDWADGFSPGRSERIKTGNYCAYVILGLKEMDFF